MADRSSLPSPGEALRTKLAQRRAELKATLDPEFMRFWAHLNSLAVETASARFEGDGAEAAAKSLFAEVASLKPEAKDQLLRERLRSLFVCVSASPVWLDEPEWPFINGKPMVFVNQTSLEETSITREHLAFGSVVYLFGARVPHDDGFSVVWRVVEQHALPPETCGPPTTRRTAG